MKIEIVLHKDEIVSDVDSIAYVTGRRLLDAGNFEKAADIQTPLQRTDSYIVARALRTAFSQVKKRCGRYLTVGRVADSNALQPLVGEYQLVLDMPSGFHAGSTAALTDAIHHYCVNFCVYSIFEKTNPAEAENYMLQAGANYNEIKSCLEQRQGAAAKLSMRTY